MVGMFPQYNKPGSRSIFARLIGQAPAPDDGPRPPMPLPGSGLSFSQQRHEIMTPQTGPTASGVEPNRVKFPNQKVSPFTQKLLEAAPLPNNKPAGPEPSIVQRLGESPASPTAVPSSDVQRAQGPAGTIQPYVPGQLVRTLAAGPVGGATNVPLGSGNSPTQPAVAATQQAGASLMPKLNPSHPLYGKSPEQMRQAVTSLQQHIDNPNSYDAKAYTAPDGSRYSGTPSPPVVGPIGTRLVGGMELSGNNRPAGATLADNRLAPASSRSMLVARLNGGSGTTLAQAAGDPSFNASGAQFGGAGLAMTPAGKAQFVDKTPTQFAGGAANAEEAAGNRVRSLIAMAKRGVGTIDPQTGAFFGKQDSNDPLAQTPDEQRARLAAGGVWKSNASQLQLDQNRADMLARLGLRGQKAEGMRQENRRQEAVARANQPSQFMMRLMGENPELAIRAMALQQQGNAAQQQFGLEQQRLAQQGQQFNANIAAQGRNAADQRAHEANLAQVNIAAAEARIGRQLTHEEKTAEANRVHAIEMQKNNPMVGLEREKLDLAKQQGEANRKQEVELAGMADKTKRDLAVNAQLGKFLEARAAQIAGNDDLSPEEKDQMLARFFVDAHAEFQRLQAAQPAVGAQQAVAQPGAPPVSVAPQPTAGPTPTFQQRLTGRTFAENTLTEGQYKTAKGITDPTQLRDKLRSYGLNDDQVTIALNSIMPPNLFGAMGPGPTRTHNDPHGYGNFFKGIYTNRTTGKKMRGGQPLEKMPMWTDSLWAEGAK